MSQITTKRRFHDFWAFALYIICLSTYAAISIGFKKPGIESFSIPQVAIVNLVTLLSMNIMALIGFRFFTKFTIYFSLAMTPILQIAFLVLYPNIAVFVLTILSFLGLLYVFSIIKRDIHTICAIITDATKILISYIFSTLAMYISLFSTCGFIVGLISISDSKESKTIGIFALFLTLWTFGIFSYIFDVFAAGIIYGHVISKVNEASNQQTNTGESSDNRSVSFIATKNTLFSLGSVCLGALLVAIIQTLRFLNAQQYQRTSRQRNGISYIFIFILYIITSIFLVFFEALVECFNRFAFPYLAVKGTSYKDSIIQSHEFISSASYPMSTWIAIEYALNILNLFGILVLGISNATYVLSTNKDDLILSAIVYGLLSSVLFSAFIRIVSSGSLGLIYTFMTEPSALEKYNTVLSTSMNQRCPVSIE